jgi:Ca-activated chloride channel family protein
VTDTSGSMQATDVHPDRLDAAREAASRFLDKVPKRVRVGAVAFSNTALTLQRPTSDRQAVKDSLASLIPQGGTATGEGIRTALRALQPPKHHRRPPSAIVLLSDGKATSGSDPVEAARVAARAKTPIYTVALGTPGGVITFNQGFTGPQTIAVPPDPGTLRRMAETSKGRFFDAGDASGLSQVYARLGSQLGTRQERREVTAAFAGGALLLLLAGAAMSLRWFGRLL